MLTIVWILGQGNFSNTAAQVAGAPSPAFNFTTLSGETISKDALKGQPALLMFWAPWCPVCRKELPALGRFYRSERPPTLRVISVGFADSLDNVVDYVKGNSETFVFPTAYDKDDHVAEAFRVTMTPTYVLLDQSGTVILVHRGGGIDQNPEYQRFLKKLKG